MSELRQTTNHILMIRPSHFGFNEETAASNAFQAKSDQLTTVEVKEKAMDEFDRMVRMLKSFDIDVVVMDDTPEFQTPDSVFPNNWVSFHENGTILTYPMFAEVRRLERSESILDAIADKFEVKAVFPLTHFESKGQFLEGTGSMVLDRAHKIAYACLSPRTHPDVFEKYCKLMGYKPVSFKALDAKGQEIYHTNVMMALGESFAILVSDAIRNPNELQRIQRNLTDSGKALIDISLKQMESFAGNMLQIRNKQNETFLVMSSQAYESLNDLQIKQIEAHTRIINCPINTIELIGGGSVRCMMAEIFLPAKK